jgi:hypothetical protein
LYPILWSLLRVLMIVLNSAATTLGSAILSVG